MYVIEYPASPIQNKVIQYSLSTAWDPTTAAVAHTFNLSTSVFNTNYGLFFKPDGTKMYLVQAGFGSPNSAIQYTLSTPWNVSTASSGGSFDISSKVSFGNPAYISFSSDGFSMYVSSETTSTIYQWTLGTAWDVTTASFTTSASASSVRSFVFKPDGTKLYKTNNSASTDVTQYDVPTPWDISTITPESTLTLPVGNHGEHTGIFFDSTGVYLFLGSTANATIQRLSTLVAPVADFTATPLTGSAPLEVSFMDASTNDPTSWLWDFGDGNTSTLQNPTHTYTVVGHYTVSLTATNFKGSDSISKDNYIFAYNPNLYLQNVFMVGADTDGDVLTFNVGKSDNEVPIYYELETQDIEFGNRAHIKKIANQIAIFTRFGAQSTIQAKTDMFPYKDIPLVLNDRVNIGDKIDLEGHYVTFKWFGSSSTTSPVFEGLYIEDVTDQGITHG